MTRFAFLIGFVVATLFAFAPSSAQHAADPDAQSIEDRARAVGKQLRCVVCQNQSIEESDAELAADMRRRVRESLEGGSTEAEVIEQMRVRYGDYVLLKPPVQGNTLILWIGPFLLLLGGLVWWATLARRKTIVLAQGALTEAEHVRLSALREETGA